MSNFIFMTAPKSPPMTGEGWKDSNHPVPPEGLVNVQPFEGLEPSQGFEGIKK